MFELALKLADAVLYEGYVLYPYRASAKKNRARWQWGVVFPADYCTARGTDAWQMRTEVLLEPRPDAELHLRVRFLQVQARIVEQDGEPVPELEVDGELLLTWDEGVAHEIDAVVALDDLPAEVPLDVPAGRAVEDRGGGVRIVRERWPVSARLTVDAETLPGPYGVRKLSARIENTTPWEDHGEDRDEAARRALVSAHTLIGVDSGAFLSLLDPPEWASGYVSLCRNEHTYPVLVASAGGPDVVLSSPIILYDHPEIAPESPGELCDSLEIDEILTLRTMTLTDEEKREARATDPRARAIIDRSDAMPQEILERLHGAIRSVRPTSVSPGAPVGAAAGGPGGQDPLGQGVPTLASSAEGRAVPWWDPGMDAAVSPTSDRVWVGSVSVGKGSRVRLQPGGQRADAQDMFLVGREAVVEAVFFSVDDDPYLAVTLTDDAEAAEVQRWHGRFLYFSPDEVVALEPEEGQAP